MSKIVINGLYQWFISEKSLISKNITCCFWFSSLLLYQATRWHINISQFVSLSAVYHFFMRFFTDNSQISKITPQSDFFKLVNFDLLHLIQASYWQIFSLSVIFYSVLANRDNLDFINKISWNLRVGFWDIKKWKILEVFLVSFDGDTQPNDLCKISEFFEKFAVTLVGIRSAPSFSARHKKQESFLETDRLKLKASWIISTCPLKKHKAVQFNLGFKNRLFFIVEL